MNRRCATCLALLGIMLLVLNHTAPAVHATVTVGGGSADFLLKTYVAGQVGAAQQNAYASSSGWFSSEIPANMTQTPAVVSYNNQFLGRCPEYRPAALPGLLRSRLRLVWVVCPSHLAQWSNLGPDGHYRQQRPGWQQCHQCVRPGR